MPFNRRSFLTASMATAMAASLLSFSGAANAAGGYETISPAQNTSAPDKVEVLEFFWLGCPHCYSFEPDILAWEAEMPENVVFVREAPPLNKSWEQHSRSFYAAQLMGKEQEFVDAMFSAIHEENKRMRKPTKLRRSIQLAKGAGITGVPSVIINGKYRTGAQLAGGNKGIINVINETIDIEKAEMGID